MSVDCGKRIASVVPFIAIISQKVGRNGVTNCDNTYLPAKNKRAGKRLFSCECKSGDRGEVPELLLILAGIRVPAAGDCVHDPLRLRATRPSCPSDNARTPRSGRSNGVKPCFLDHSFWSRKGSASESQMGAFPIAPCLSAITLSSSDPITISILLQP